MTRVFVWKNQNPKEWEEITFEAFSELRKTEEGKGRYFTFLTKDICDDAENLLMECDYETYKKYSAADRRARYLRKEMFSCQTLSTFGVSENSEEYSLEELLPDVRIDVEADAMEHVNLEQLTWALERLEPEEKELILKLYDAERRSMLEVAREYGITNAAMCQRKKKIEKKLKKLLNIF